MISFCSAVKRFHDSDAFAPTRSASASGSTDSWGRFSSTLCLCLCQTNLHMRVARKHLQTGKNYAHSTLPTAEEACLRSQKHSFQLGSPSSDSMRAALSVRRRPCHQITQQLGAFRRPVFHKSRRPTVAQPSCNALLSPLPPSNCSFARDPQTQVTNLCRPILVLELFKPRRPDSTPRSL